MTEINESLIHKNTSMPKKISLHVEIEPWPWAQTFFSNQCTKKFNHNQRFSHLSCSYFWYLCTYVGFHRSRQKRKKKSCYSSIKPETSLHTSISGCLTHDATGPRRGHQRLSTEPSSPWMAHRDQGMIHTVCSPTRSTPSRSGKSINGTRAVLGSGSCSGRERNRSWIDFTVQN
jgi:hypothetical protein